MGLLLPSSCVLCDCSVSRAISLCESCENDLPVLSNACKQCGLPFEGASEISSVCGQCVQSPTSVDYTMCLYHYQAPLDYLVMQLKYKQKLVYAEILGQLLLTRIKQMPMDDFPDCIIPVPLHKKRLVSRGFNQSLEIAKPIAKSLKLPIDLGLVRRTRQTRAQADLKALERKKNVKNCFEISKHQAVKYGHIVIIDDVVTTGSTINELAKQLKQAGVQKVGVWSIARAVLVV